MTIICCFVAKIFFCAIDCLVNSQLITLYFIPRGRRGGLMVRVLDTGSSGPGSGPGWGHCVVFLGKTLYSHGASLHPGV